MMPHFDCPQCKNALVPLVTPKSGIDYCEWYCPICHKSFPMDQDDALFFIQQRQAQGVEV